ncbi:MAG: sulfotransferase [Desulfobacter sp.]
MSRKKKKKAKRVRKSGSTKKTFSPSVVSQWIARGIKHHQAGDPGQAEPLYRQALSIDPENTDALIRLGHLYISSGNWEEAVACFKKTTTLMPAHMESHFSLGVALERLNRFDEAAASYETLLVLKPDLFEALNNLANLLNRKGDFDRAVPLYEKALAVRPDSPDVYNNLGVALLRTERLEQALECIKKAISLKPDYADAYNSLGNACEKAGWYQDAVGSYQQAIAIRPDHAQTHYNLGLVLERTGNVPDAVACLKTAVSLAPGHAQAHRHLANAVRHDTEDDDIRAMVSLYREQGISAEDKMHLGFGLAKAYADLNAYETSFAFLHEANRLKRGMFPYAIEEERLFFKNIKAAFTEAFCRQDRGGCDDATPVFILGMPRSGTTLVEQILASHPRVYGAGELTGLSRIMTTLTRGSADLSVVAGLPDKVLAHAGAAYVKQLRGYSEDAAHITDKMPHNFLFAGFIHRILPKARIIHCTRDPMDTCFSIFKNLFTPGHSHKYAYDLEELGEYYGLYQDLMAHWRNVLPNVIYKISYEALVANQEEETRKLLEFCGIPWDENCLFFYKTQRPVSTTSSRQVRKPIYRDSVRLWERYAPWLTPLKSALEATRG